MKKSIKIVLLLSILITVAPQPVFATTNLQLVNNYCRSTYGKKPRIISQKNVRYSQFVNRKNKKYVYVIKFITKSYGTYGYTFLDSYICYNRYVTPGKKVVVYYIYNPDSNYEDDVVARVANNRIKIYLRKVR